MGRKYDKCDVRYHIPGKNGKPVRIAGSTIATALLLSVICDNCPGITIGGLYDIITDRNFAENFILHNEEAERVLDAYIKKGCKDCVANFKLL